MPLKQMRIGQRALERVVLARRARRGRRARSAVEHLQAAADRAPPAPPRPRTTCSEARFFVPASVRSSVPVGKSKAARPTLPGYPGAAPRLPAQASGDHQVQHQEELALEADHDALAQPPEARDPPADEAREGRLDGAQQERAGQPDRLQRLAQDAGREAAGRPRCPEARASSRQSAPRSRSSRCAVRRLAIRHERLDYPAGQPELGPIQLFFQPVKRLVADRAVFT